MTCCIVGLLILSVVGRIRRVAGGAQTPELFAPVAQRPAPGQELVVPVLQTDPPPASVTPVLRYAAFGLGLCLAVAPLLVWTGLMENTGSPVMWLARAACYLALIVVAVVLSRGSLWLHRRGAGWFLIVLGAVVFETGILDMHVFGVIEVDHDNLLGDAVFHNVGPVLAAVGGLLLAYGAAGRRRTSRRSSRSTVTSARPSSSAVTVSSTPPVTT